MSAELRGWRVDDPQAWNAFVESVPYHAFPQLWEWGQLRIDHGWRPVRLAVGPSRDEPLAGAQLLLRRIPLVGWHLAYVPRGPVGHLDDPLVRDGLERALRALGRAERIATIRADPEATPQTAYGTALLDEPWRAAPKVQPPITRIIDLTVGPDALRAAMRRKHRQYVNKAEREGLEVDRFEGSSFPPSAVADALADFNRIYRQTAERAGFVARAPEYYERVWGAFAPGNHVRLSFAVRGGERVAALFHFTCGDRVVESYGGMTDAGADLRANYLLKWAAIRDFAREGFAIYDMWGLATGGIRQFKEGFGGTEIAYVGARDLPLRAPVDAALRLALPAYGILQRVRHRLLGGRGAAHAGDETTGQPAA